MRSHTLTDLSAAVFPVAGGYVGIAASSAGLRRLTLPCGSAFEALAEVGIPPGEETSETSEILGEMRSRLERYFDGAAVDFADLALDLEGRSPFQREVLEAVRAIPRGEVRSYGQMAAAVGRPGAARAVGAVMAANPVCIVVPCHRVIGSDGSLTGFGGDLALKGRMLEMEGHRVAGGFVRGAGR